MIYNLAVGTTDDKFDGIDDAPQRASVEIEGHPIVITGDSGRGIAREISDAGLEFYGWIPVRDRSGRPCGWVNASGEWSAT